MKNIFRNLLPAFILLSTAFSAQAEILFEGYYKVSQFKKHVGFAVQRNELDPKTNQFKTTYFVRLSKNGFDLTESLTTASDGELAPLSFNYLSANGSTTTSTAATFKNGKMSAVVTSNGKVSKIEKTIPKGTFLSAALYYLMLKSKEGLKTDVKFDFNAVAEEMADVKQGTTAVDKKMVTQGSLQLFKVKNKFAGSEYENLITDRGEIVQAIIPAGQLETVLVKSSEEALEGVKVNSSVMEKLFGTIPTGKVNVYHAKGK